MDKYYQNEPKFNGVYSRDNLHKIKNWAYVVNLDKQESVGNHWIALYINGDKVTYSLYKAKWRIPKLILKVYTISLML